MEDVFYKTSRTVYQGVRRNALHWKNVFTDPAPKIIVLAYHRVLPEISFDPFNMAVSLKTFVKQLDAIAKKYSVISLAEAVKQCASGAVKAKTQVVLTFDDGYKDNYCEAFPVLRKKGLPAAFFIITDYVSRNKPLWEWHVAAIIFNDGNIDNVRLNEINISKGAVESRRQFIRRIIEEMKALDQDARDAAIDSLKKEYENEKTCITESDISLTWDEINRMSKAGMEIGAHSMSHRSLARITFEDAQAEISGSKAAIEEKLMRSCKYFAFPFGSEKDYNQRLIECVKGAGYTACLTNIRGYNHSDPGIFTYKRMSMDEASSGRHLLG